MPAPVPQFLPDGPLWKRTKEGGGAERRQCSLFSSSGERDRYRIAVALAASGRGGSAYLHQRVRPGNPLRAGLPRNRFPLDGARRRSMMIRCSGCRGERSVLGL
ncbi:MAG: hypothetical protein QM601_10850 [Pseudoxanthomonas sp.]